MAPKKPSKKKGKILPTAAEEEPVPVKPVKPVKRKGKAAAAAGAPPPDAGAPDAAAGAPPPPDAGAPPAAAAAPPPPPAPLDEDSDGPAGPAGAAPKKSLIKYALPIGEEEALLEWLRENPILWRKGHMEYRDAQKKKAMWIKKAEELGRTVDYLKKWWKGIHDTYVRKLKKTSGQEAPTLTDREQWVMEHCGFYKSEARHRSAPLKNVSI